MRPGLLSITSRVEVTQNLKLRHRNDGRYLQADDSRRSGSLLPTPHTLHPQSNNKPYTFNHTLHPSPSITPYNLHPQSLTLFLENPSIRNPSLPSKADTNPGSSLHPQTLIFFLHKPSIRNPSLPSNADTNPEL